MSNTLINSKWENVLAELSSYTGTVTSFCKEKNINKNQLYYYKRKSQKVSDGVFQAITLKEKTQYKLEANSSNNIKIEIGNAKIYVPSNEIEALSTIIKELSQSV